MKTIDLYLKILKEVRSILVGVCASLMTFPVDSKNFDIMEKVNESVYKLSNLISNLYYEKD